MNIIKSMNKKRILSFVLAIIILLVMAFSVYFVITHADHNCTGTDCPVCCAIHISQKIIELLGTALSTTFMAYLYKILFCNKYIENISRIYESLFSLKVRLNN